MFVGFLTALTWVAALYCQSRTWTPGVKTAWAERRSRGFVLPRNLPPQDILGPRERVWYQRVVILSYLWFGLFVLYILLSGLANA